MLFLNWFIFPSLHSHFVYTFLRLLFDWIGVFYNFCFVLLCVCARVGKCFDSCSFQLHSSIDSTRERERERDETGASWMWPLKLFICCRYMNFCPWDICLNLGPISMAISALAIGVFLLSPSLSLSLSLSFAVSLFFRRVCFANLYHKYLYCQLMSLVIACLHVHDMVDLLLAKLLGIQA